VKKHLEKVGFMPDYWVWIYNGEQFQNFGVGVNAQVSSSGINANDNEQFNMMNDMVADALGVELSYNDDVEDEQGEEPPNEQAQFRQAQAQDPSHTRAPVLSPNVEPYPVDRDDEDGDEED